jgi:hypothetical protein
MMLLLEPRSPYAATFERTADAIAARAAAEPLFQGADGAAKTAALLVSLGWFESRFDPSAGGDCTKRLPNGLCAPGGTPHSHCAFQLNDSNFVALDVTADMLRTDVDLCVATTLRMLRTSLSVCRRLPLEERLAHYAGGGDTCDNASEDARAKSRHRWFKAQWLYARMKKDL